MLVPDENGREAQFHVVNYRPNVEFRFNISSVAQQSMIIEFSPSVATDHWLIVKLMSLYRCIIGQIN